MHEAIIFAGGKGERLRPLTSQMPKPMIPVADDKPLLWFTLSWLKSHGIERVVICCGYLHEVITEYFGDGSQMGLHIEYLLEDKPLGRGGALKSAMQHLSSSKPVLALNGDFLTDLDIADLEAFHASHGGIATLVTTPLVSSYGIVETEGTRVVNFKEKPKLPHSINAGIYIFDPSVVGMLPAQGDHEVETLPVLAARGQLHAFHSQGYWRTIDTMKDLTDLRQELPEVTATIDSLKRLLTQH